MKKTGQILKEAREAKSISLQEVSIHLKINTKTLKSLELGDKNQLPAKTFLRGFVQSYAQFLKLDLNQIMEVFQNEMGSTHPGMITAQIAQAQQLSQNPTAQQHQMPVNSLNAHFQSIPKANIPNANITPNLNPTKPITTNSNVGTTSPNASNPKSQMNEPVPPSISFDPQTWSHSLKIGTAILVLIIISVIIGLKKTIDKYEREATLPKQENSLTELISNPTMISNDNPISTEAPALNSASIPINSEGTLANLNITKEALALTSKPAPKPESSEIPTPAADATVENTTSSPQPSPTIAESAVEGPQEVIIEALDKVTIDYSIDDGPKTSMTLLTEKIHTFKAQKNIKLSFSDGGAVNLIHNGKDKGVPGTLGQPSEVSFPK
jgi:cytoskeleton protein RodZ